MTTRHNRPEDVARTGTSMSSPPTDSAQVLRRQAEDLFRERTIKSEDDSLSLDKTRQMLYELQVHQIELEMQNEELRRTHVELDLISKRYYDLYELAPTGYCTLSEKGLFVETNLTAATLLGIHRKKLINQPISRFIFKEDQDIYYLYRKKLFATGEPQTCDLRMVKEDGTIIWTTLVTTVAQDVDGTPVCRLLMSDITELKKTQEEKTNHHLEILQKKAERRESIGRLAGGVAHNFNNMLGVILGYTELALDRVNPTQPLHADLSEIRKAAERCADLTQQLLVFAGRQVVAPKIINLNQTVEEKLKVVWQEVGENIHFTWLPGADLWQLKLDPVQLGQILTNLCKNARDAIAGSGTIIIKTENTTVDEAHRAELPWLIPGEYVQLTVSDNGCGIDQVTINNLFEPFFTTKELYERAGLGLATVYGAVKQNGGFIDVRSTPEQGTTFTIYLPRYVGVDRKEPAEDAVQPTVPGQKTILVVDDEPIVLEFVTTLLEMKGYTVFATSNAHEAFRLAREHAGNINLLLTDVLMPEMNGDELAKKLLAAEPSLKCLFMSGYTADIVTHSGFLGEDIHFIQKPFTLNSLIAKVKEAMESEILPGEPTTL